MAQCPMTSSWTNDFHTNCIVNGTGNIRDIIDFNQSFVGGSSGGPVDGDSWNSSFHGYQEVVGDTYFLCARYYEDVDSGGLSGEYKWLDFVACMNGADGLAGIEFIPGNAGRCGKEVSRRAIEREARIQCSSLLLFAKATICFVVHRAPRLPLTPFRIGTGRRHVQKG